MPAKREVVGLWPRFYATIRLLCHRSREHVYVILREAMRSTFFCCHIAQMQATTIASRAMTHDELIFMLYHNERTTIRIFHRTMTTWYCKERASARRIAMSKRF